MKISFPYDTVFDFWNDSEVSVDFESLNNNTLEFIQLQCRNILTKRKLNDPPKGTTVLERKTDEGIRP